MPQEATPSFWELVREDWQRHHRDWTRPGFRAMCVYRFGAWRRTLANPWLRKPLGLVYYAAHRFVRNVYGIELHATSTIGRRLLLPHQGGIVLHEYVEIGNDCIVRQGVSMGSGTAYSRTGAPKLGDRVNVGANAVIIGPVTIGDDVRISPNALVMSDVPSGARVVTPPGRVMVLPKQVSASSNTGAPIEALDLPTAAPVAAEP